MCAKRKRTRRRYPPCLPFRCLPFVIVKVLLNSYSFQLTRARNPTARSRSRSAPLLLLTAARRARVCVVREGDVCLRNAPVGLLRQRLQALLRALALAVRLTLADALRLRRRRVRVLRSFRRCGEQDERACVQEVRRRAQDARG